MKKDLSVLADQITSALNDYASVAQKEARKGYKQARSTVDDRMSDWSDRGYAMADQAYDAALSLEESLEERIAERPLAAVGIAVALGILIGSAWKR